MEGPLAAADGPAVACGLVAVELTADQDGAIGAIRDDLARPTPMLRLLQGDVGSGKTAVAAWALAAAARAGLQGALLAPTDLLARQHHRTLASLLEDAAIPVELLTGSLSAATTRQTLDLVHEAELAYFRRIGWL